MKKKIYLIVVVLLLCSGFILGTNYYKNTLNNNKNNLEEKQNKINQDSNNIVENDKDITKEKNLYIKDEVSGKIIVEGYCNFEGRSVADATIEILDKNSISYKTVGNGENVYFSSINEIRERSEGALSGWCYYVNGGKPSVSAGTYKLKKGDKIEWRFKKDAVSK